MRSRTEEQKSYHTQLNIRADLAVKNIEAFKGMEADYEKNKISDRGVARTTQELYQQERRMDTSYDPDDEAVLEEDSD